MIDSSLDSYETRKRKNKMSKWKPINPMDIKVGDTVKLQKPPSVEGEVSSVYGPSWWKVYGDGDWYIRTVKTPKVQTGDVWWDEEDQRTWTVLESDSLEAIQTLFGESPWLIRGGRYTAEFLDFSRPKGT